MSDIYVVVDPVGARVVGASARLQGAEVIRSDEAVRIAGLDVGGFGTRAEKEAHFYARLQVVNVELRDMED